MTPADDPELAFDLLGWPPDGPKLRLDHERFSYAGKFVMTNAGKAVAREPGTESNASVGETESNAPVESEDDPATDGIVAAASFNEDRTDDDRLWIRYVTVARERRGEGIGPDLVAFVRDRAVERGYERVRIAVNNPFAYEACYRAGFAFTAETTGIAELVLEYDVDGGERSVETYRDGLERFRDRDLGAEEVAFLERTLDRERPEWLE